jgi:Terminase small subunit
VATNPPRRPGTRSSPSKRRRKLPENSAAASPEEKASEEVLERAAQLGITAERVLQEYARIAFADLRRVAEWGHDRFVLKSHEDLSEADAAAISEIVELGSGGYRVKLYDKKAALDAIARHLGLFMREPRRKESAAPSGLAEDAREVLACRLARLASGSSEK